MAKKRDIENPEELFKYCVRYTNKKMMYEEGNRNNYIFLLSCNCNRRGLTEEQTIYYACEEFDLNSDEIKQTVSSAFNNKNEHNTITDLEDKPAGAQIDEIENYLIERYVFRFNVVTGMTEYHKHGSEKFIQVKDYIENSMFREIKKAQIKCSGTLLHTILNSDFCPEYNPFTTYFESLPKWDGVTDHIAALAATVKTTEPHWEKCFRKWIVAMVACAIEDQIINHTVIVFTGKQGIGKTTWIENLIVHELRRFLYSGTIQPGNKDTLVHLSECILIDLDELENLSKQQIGSLKEIITKSNIRIRRAYGRNNESLPRRASFAGSVNTAQFLTDTTGNRRFLCFNVTEIDYQHKIDMSDVYAQAFHLYKSGFKFWFDKAEIAEITAHNEKFRVRSTEEEWLLTWFQKPGEDETYVQRLTTTEIAAKLADKCKLKISVHALGKALHKHEYKHGKSRGRQVWVVIENSHEDVARIAREDMEEEKQEPESPAEPFPF